MNFELVGEITEVETCAVSSAIREWPRLRRAYGSGRWRKRKGVAFVRSRNFQHHFQTRLDLLQRRSGQEPDGPQHQCLIEGRDVDAGGHADLAESRTDFDCRVQHHFRTRNTVASVRDLDQNGVVNQPIEEVGLDDDRRAQFTPAHVSVLPVHFDDFAANHTSFRMRSSSAGLSQARPKGFSSNRTLS